MTADELLATHRIRILELAQELGNVSEACRQGRLTRTQFYVYKRRYELHGFEGLKNRAPVHKTHPQTISPELVKYILGLSLAHPTWGCVRLAEHLKMERKKVSSSTIQSILIKNCLGRKDERLLQLQEREAAGFIKLSNEQLRAIEQFNPCFWEREEESTKPGEFLTQMKFRIGKLAGAGPIFLDAIVDTYCSYAFASLHTNHQPQYTVTLLCSEVLPSYKELGLTVVALETPYEDQFSESKPYPYKSSLQTLGIVHSWRDYPNNGFVERFYNIAMEEFFVSALREGYYEGLEALQIAFNRWLIHYNTVRVHSGYRNFGKPPREMIRRYLQSATK